MTRALVATALLAATGSAMAQDAEIRVLHFSPDTPAVDVFVNDGVPAAITNLDFQQGTGYIPLPPALYNFKASAAGLMPSDAVIDVDLDLMAGVKYSAVAFDELSNIQPLALVDDDTNIPAGGVRLQLVHAAVGVGDVNVSLLDGGGALLKDFPFGGVAQVDRPAGEFVVGLDVDGDNFADFKFEVPDLGADIFVNALVGTDDTGAPFVLAWLPDGSTAVVQGEAIAPAGLRALHLSPDAPSVDLYLNNSMGLAAGGLPFEGGTDYLDVPAGKHTIGLTAAGSGGPPVAKLTEFLKSDKDYTLVAFGNLSNLEVAVVRDDDDGTEAGPGNYTLRLFHAADGVGMVDVIELSSNTVVVPSLDYATGGTLTLPNAPLSVGLDVDLDGTSDFDFDIPALGDMIRVDAYAVLDATGTPFVLAHLPDGTTVRIDATP